MGPGPTRHVPRRGQEADDTAKSWVWKLRARLHTRWLDAEYVVPCLAFGGHLTCAVFETELMEIQGVKPEPVPASSVAKPEPTPEPAPEPTPLPKEDTLFHSIPDPATAAPTTAPTKTAVVQGSPLDEEKSNGECNLLGNFALFVQGALGLLAVSSLAVKRWREHPRRPVKIWFFDASKQVFGSVLLHLANVLMSMLSSGKFDVAAKTATVAGDGEDQPNPCSFYLLNLAIDVSFNSRYFQSILLILLDHNRHSHSRAPPQDTSSWRPPHAPRQSSRVHPLRQLRPPTTRNMVAEAIHHILPRATPHETLRPRYFCLPPLDCMGRRLGAALD